MASKSSKVSYRSTLLGIIRDNAGIQADDNRIPPRYRPLLRPLEKKGCIEWKDNGWHVAK